MWYGVVIGIIVAYLVHKFDKNLKVLALQHLSALYYRGRCSAYGGIFKKDINPTHEIRPIDLPDWKLTSYNLKSLIDWDNINVQIAGGNETCKSVYEALVDESQIDKMEKIDRLVFYTNVMKMLVITLDKRHDGLDMYVDMSNIDNDVIFTVYRLGYLAAVVTGVMVEMMI